MTGTEQPSGPQMMGDESFPAQLQKSITALLPLLDAIMPTEPKPEAKTNGERPMQNKLNLSIPAFLTNRKFVTPIATFIALVLAMVIGDNVDAVNLTPEIENLMLGFGALYNVIVVGGDVMYDRAVVNASAQPATVG